MSDTFTLNPNLMIYVDDVEGSLRVCLETVSRRPPLVADDPLLVWALMVLPRRFTEDEAKRIWGREATGDVVNELWAFLLTNELVGEAVEPAPATHVGYHMATRAHPFLDMSTGYDAFAADNAVMSGYRAQSQAPSPYLELEYLDTYPLHRAADLSDPFLRVDPAQHLALVFDGTFGSRAKIPGYSDLLWGYAQDELLLKPIPSGGGRHPTEAFALIRYPGLRPGLYHYNVRQNVLGRLGDHPGPAVLDRVSGAIRESTPAGTIVSVVLFLASMVERAMFRYRDPRSFRAVVVDAGHAVGQLAELAQYVGLRYSHVPDFDASAVSELLPLAQWRTPVIACGVLSR